MQVDQIRVLDTGLLHATCPFASLVPPPLDSSDHRAGELSSLGLARWGTPLAVRAVLQNFRC